MNCSQGRPESLASYLARLHPGDSCACCGATLRSADPDLKTSREFSASRGLRLGGAVLVCPACGCEISEEPDADVEGGMRELSPAA